MTPKKQAQKLFDEFYDAVDQHWNQVPVAKQCALIAVDEIIVYLDAIMLPNPFKQYWNKVKQEIEKL